MNVNLSQFQENDVSKKQISVNPTLVQEIAPYWYLSTNVEVEKEKFVAERGTNLAHFLSQSNRRGAERESFLGKNDIATIAEMGFDHVRLPIDEEQMWDEQGNRHADAFLLMTNVLDWCAGQERPC